MSEGENQENNKKDEIIIKEEEGDDSAGEGERGEDAATAKTLPSSQPQEQKKDRQKKPAKWQLPDPTDYRSIRKANRLADPFKLYHGEHYIPSSIYKAVEPGGNDHFYLMSPVSGPDGKPEKTLQYNVGVDIGIDEIADIRLDYSRSVKQQKNQSAQKVREAEVDDDAAAAATTSQAPRPKHEKRISVGTEASESLIESDKKLSEEIKGVIRRELGITKTLGEVADDPVISNRMLPYAKTGADRVFLTSIMTQNVAITESLTDIGIEALLMAFKMARLSPEEMRHRTLSFKSKDELVQFVNEQLIDAWAALQESPEELMEELKNEVYVWHANFLTMQNVVRRLDGDMKHLKSDFDLATSLLNPAQMQQFQNYKHVISIDPNYGPQVVRKQIIDAKMNESSQGYYNVNPKPGNGHSSTSVHPSAPVPSAAPPSAPRASEGGQQAPAGYNKARMSEFEARMNELMNQVYKTEFPDLRPEHWEVRKRELEEKGL
jgi:hypothetical protein